MWIGKATGSEGGYRWIVARNQRYNTISIAVPTRVLQDCVNDALTITWAAPLVPRPENGLSTGVRDTDLT